MNYRHLIQLLNQHSGIIIFSLDQNYRYTFFTQTHRLIMKKIWGVEINQGDNMLSFIASPDKEKAKANFDRALAGETFTLLEEYGDEKLHRTWWEDRYSPIKDKKGNSIGVSVFVIEVTKHLDVLQKLKDVQERLNLALRASQTGIWEWNLKTNEVFWSDEVYKIFDVDPGHFNPSYFIYMNAIYPDDRPMVEASIRDAVSKQNLYRVEHRITDSKGKIKWVFGTGSVITDSNGQPVRMIGVVRDITERVLNNERLQESEQKFRHVVEYNPMGIMLCELNDKDELILTQLNAGAEKILGIKAENITGMPIEKAFPGLAETDIPTHYRHAARYGKRWFMQELNYYDEVIQGVYEIYAFQAGKNRVAIFFLDITARKKNEKELADWKLRHNLLLQASGQIIYDYDVSSGLIQWFGDTEKILGFTNEEMGNINLWSEHIHPDDREAILAELERSEKTFSKFDVVYRFATRQGDYRYIGDRGFFFQEEPTLKLRMLGIMEDITDKKKAQLELLKKNEELLKINQELDRFVYSASHDLRAPLASLLGLIHVARMEKLPTELNRLFDLKEKTLNRMDRFISDIVNYSRNTRLQIETSPVDLRQLINETIEQLDYLDLSVSIRKEIIIESACPFFSDPGRLRIIFNNLLSNAIKYADANKPDPFIKITATINPKTATVIIEDNGEGIPAEAQGKIFQMFYRASVNKSGSGLGLYIVKEVVEKLQGTITMKSVFERGTTFIITLPNRAGR